MEQDVFGPVMTISDSLLMSVLIKSYNKKVYFVLNMLVQFVLSRSVSQ